MGRAFQGCKGVLFLAVGLAACSSADLTRTPHRPVALQCDGGVCPDAAIVGAAPGAGGGPADTGVIDKPDGHIRFEDSSTGPKDAEPPVREAGPRCGNGKVDPGEQCDDGNRDGGDGCRNDCTKPACVHDADCDDKLFCDGVETCADGHCVPGLPIAVSDQIACTVDSCDEASHAVQHTPTDTVCSNLDVAPTCATVGVLAGKIVKQTGVCDVTTGCHAVASVVDDCLDDVLHPTTYSCSASGPAEILKHEGTCTAGATTCSYTSTVENSCTGNLPTPACIGSATSKNLAYQFGAVATCGGGASPSCGSSQTTAACNPGNPACAAGKLTTYTPTCNTATGCGKTANAPTACPDSPDACTTSPAGAPVFTTYTPACANGTSCGPAAPTATTCAAGNPSCAAGMLTTFTSTCSAAGGCSKSANAPTSCSHPANTCAPSAAGAPALTTYAATCASGTACGAAAPTVKSCTAAAPICVTAAPAPTKRTYSAACNAGGSACASPGTASDVVCAAGATTCAKAVLTTHPANCTGAGVCGTTTATTPCNDPASTCTAGKTGSPVLTTYAPQCSGNACGTATPTQTTCAPTTANSCSRARVYTAWSGTCTATTELCGQKSATTNCAAADSQTCKGITQVTTNGTCTAAGGCGTNTSTYDCNHLTCADTDTSSQETGCAAGTCSIVLTPCGGVGCNPNTGQCNIIG